MANLTIGTPVTSTAASYSFDPGASAEIMVVGVSNNSSGVPSVTFNGVAMTAAKTYSDGGNMAVGIFYKVSPGAGSHTVAITNGNQSFSVGVWGGVDTSSPIGATFGNSVGATFDNPLTTQSAVWAAFSANIFDSGGPADTISVVSPGVQIYNSGALRFARTASYINSSGSTADFNWTTSGTPVDAAYCLVEIKSTLSVVPVVTTQAVTSIADTTATGNGNITNTGGATPDKRGFVWSTSSHSDPGNTAPASSAYSGNVEATGSFSTGAFTGSLTGLSENTTYYVRAYAHNTNGYSYGSEVSFLTHYTTTILVDSFGQSDVSGTGTGTASFSFNNAAGTFMFVAVMDDNTGVTVTGVTYNSVSLTSLYSDLADATTNLWTGYLQSPATGAHTLAVTFSGAVDAFRTGAITFTGVDSGNPMGASTSHKYVDNNTTPISTSLTVNGTKGIVVDAIHGSRTSPGNANNAQTSEMNNSGTWGGAVSHLGGMSIQSHNGGSVAMKWESLTFDSNQADQIHYLLELNPVQFIPQVQIL